MHAHRTNSRGDPYSYKNGHPLLAARSWAKNKQRDWEGPRSCDDSENPIVISPRSLSLACSSGDWSSDEDLPDLSRTPTIRTARASKRRAARLSPVAGLLTHHLAGPDSSSPPSPSSRHGEAARARKLEMSAR